MEAHSPDSSRCRCDHRRLPQLACRCQQTVRLTPFAWRCACLTAVIWRISDADSTLSAITVDPATSFNSGCQPLPESKEISHATPWPCSDLSDDRWLRRQVSDKWPDGAEGDRDGS